MDIDAIDMILNNAVSYGLLLIPVIVGFVQMLKQTIIPEAHRKKVVPIVSVMLGVGFLFGLIYGGQIVRDIFTGIVIGLASCGLWTGGKAVVKKATSVTVNNSGSVRLRALTLLTVFSFVVLAGCAMLPKPKSPAQALLYVEASFSATVRTATVLVEEGVLDTDEALRVQSAAHEADHYLDDAWEVCGVERPNEAEARVEQAGEIVCTDGPTAAQKLRMAENALDVIDTELRRHGR